MEDWVGSQAMWQCIPQHVRGFLQVGKRRDIGEETRRHIGRLRDISWICDELLAFELKQNPFAHAITFNASLQMWWQEPFQNLFVFAFVMNKMGCYSVLTSFVVVVIVVVWSVETLAISSRNKIVISVEPNMLAYHWKSTFFIDYMLFTHNSEWIFSSLYCMGVPLSLQHMRTKGW